MRIGKNIHYFDFMNILELNMDEQKKMEVLFMMDYIQDL